MFSKHLNIRTYLYQSKKRVVGILSKKKAILLFLLNLLIMLSSFVFALPVYDQKTKANIALITSIILLLFVLLVYQSSKTTKPEKQKSAIIKTKQEVIPLVLPPPPPPIVIA